MHPTSFSTGPELQRPTYRFVGNRHPMFRKYLPSIQARVICLVFVVRKVRESRDRNVPSEWSDPFFQRVSRLTVRWL